MAIYMTGIDHNKADVDMRSVFSITKSEAEQLIQDIKNINGIKGCVIISTCNRMELWLSTTRDWSGSPFDILCDYHGVSTDDYEEFLDDIWRRFNLYLGDIHEIEEYES